MASWQPNELMQIILDALKDGPRLWSELGRQTGISFTTVNAMERRGLLIQNAHERTTRRGTTVWDVVISRIPEERWSLAAKRFKEKRRMEYRAHFSEPSS